MLTADVLTGRVVEVLSVISNFGVLLYCVGAVSASLVEQYVAGGTSTCIKARYFMTYQSPTPRT
jgi:hypothetical protein